MAEYEKLRTGASAPKAKSSMRTHKRAEKIFIAQIFIWPAICFLVSYILPNVNSFILSFQTYNEETQTFQFITGGDYFRNFTRIFKELTTIPGMNKMVTNSIFLQFFTLLIPTPINILVAFLIYKKVPFNKFFVIIIFLPSIISSMVWVLFFKYFVEFGLPELVGNPDMMSLILNPQTSFQTLIFFGFWIGIGGGLLIMTGAMMRVPRECIESALLDGCNLWNEFWHITWPFVYETWSVTMLTFAVGFFTASPNTFAFFGQNAPLETYTFGYYFFKIIVGNKGMIEYPYAAAAGLLFTVIAAPLVFLTKWLLSKGPSIEV